MRDIRFVATHRGGRLDIGNHRLLMGWAIACSEHVLHLLGEHEELGLEDALHIAKEWQSGKVRTGDAIKASRNAHAAARDYDDPVKVAVARSVGHCVATAHMADHCVGAGLYALKAVNLAGLPVGEEREWQMTKLEELPYPLALMVSELMSEKEKHFLSLRD